MNRKIRFLVMDVDGTLTNGKIYMGNGGELFKSFDIKDGCGIHDILPVYGIVPVIITARTSQITENRCKELGIDNLFQGIRNKMEKLQDIICEFSVKDDISYTFENVAYIGDDLLDIPCMTEIREMGGVTGCPKDAIKEVKNIATFISQYAGGNGAVREFIEWIVNSDVV